MIFSADSVYMSSHAGRNEFVLSEVGKVYAGTHNKIAGTLKRLILLRVKSNKTKFTFAGNTDSNNLYFRSTMGVWTTSWYCITSCLPFVGSHCRTILKAQWTRRSSQSRKSTLSSGNIKCFMIPFISQNNYIMCRLRTFYLLKTISIKLRWTLQMTGEFYKADGMAITRMGQSQQHGLVAWQF